MHGGEIMGLVGNEAKWKLSLLLNLCKVLLASSLEHQTIDSLLGILLRFGLNESSAITILE